VISVTKSVYVLLYSKLWHTGTSLFSLQIARNVRRFFNSARRSVVSPSECFNPLYFVPMRGKSESSTIATASSSSASSNLKRLHDCAVYLGLGDCRCRLRLVYILFLLLIRLLMDGTVSSTDKSMRGVAGSKVASTL
jgi:hypothetical protein